MLCVSCVLSGNTITKDTIRFGTIVDFKGNKSFAWRHWGCVTAKQLTNIKESVGSASDLDGYDELKDEDKAKLDTAFEVGHVAEEDIPETAKGGDGEEDEEEEGTKKRKRKAPAKKV